MFSMTKVSDRILRIELPGNVFAYLIPGIQQAVLVDTGCGYGDLRKFVSMCTDLPVKVLLTHGHVDHAGGASQFDEVYLNPMDNEIRDKHTQKGIRKGYLLGSIKAEELHDNLLVEPCTDTLPLHDGDTFDLGGVHVTVWDLAGHTPGSMAVYIQEERTVILGDALNSATYLQLDHSLSVETYRRNVEAFRAKHSGEIDICLYSHPHNFGGTEIFGEAIACCDDILNGDLGIKDARGHLAKPVDKEMKRMDGKTFNCYYRTISD